MPSLFAISRKVQGLQFRGFHAFGRENLLDHHGGLYCFKIGGLPNHWIQCVSYFPRGLWGVSLYSHTHPDREDPAANHESSGVKTRRSS